MDSGGFDIRDPLLTYCPYINIYTAVQQGRQECFSYSWLPEVLPHTEHFGSQIANESSYREGLTQWPIQIKTCTSSPFFLEQQTLYQQPDKRKKNRYFNIAAISWLEASSNQSYHSFLKAFIQLSTPNLHPQCPWKGDPSPGTEHKWWNHRGGCDIKHTSPLQHQEIKTTMTAISFL